MNSAILSYVLANVANIADVNPSDVHVSIRGRNVVLNDVALRTDTMNKILPVPIESGVASELSVQVPNPTTADPVRAEVKGAHLTLPLELAFPAKERTMEEILQDITDATILGGVASAAEPVEAAATLLYEREAHGDANGGETDGSVGSAASISASPGVVEAFDTVSSHADSDMMSLCSANDDDLHSCRSDSDATDAGSVSQEDEDDGEEVGWFAYLWEKASKSMEWIWQRPIEIVFTDLALTLPCDPRKHARFELKAAEFAVTVEPQRAMGLQRVKMIHITVRDVVVYADHGDHGTETRPEVLSVGAVGLTVTKVYAARGNALLRSHIAVSFPSRVRITADEETLHALVRCKATRDIVLALPSYCRPFANLRNDSSLWPYVTACVLARVRDQRSRWNFTLSHLRFFARSRERYLRLLDHCHQARTVDGSQKELAEAEQDLRYTDVILCLRQRMQRRYAAQLSASLTAPLGVKSKAAAAAESPSLSGVKVISSTHVTVELVEVCLPAKTLLQVRQTSLIIRDRESIFTVADVTAEAEGKVQGLRRPQLSLADAKGQDGSQVAQHAEKSNSTDASFDASAPPLICIHQRSPEPGGGSTAETRIELSEAGIHLHLDAVHAVAEPLLDVLSELGLRERLPVAAAESSSHAAGSEAICASHVFICAVPRLTLRVDMLTLLVDRLTITRTEVDVPGQPPDFPRYGCTLKELSVRGDDGVYLLSPFDVKMRGDNDAVVVSPVQGMMSERCWAFSRSVRDRVQRLLERVPPPLLAKQAQLAAANPTSATPSLTFDTLEECLRSLPSWKDLQHRTQSVVIEGLRAGFEPLQLHVTVSRVQVTRTVMPGGERRAEKAVAAHDGDVGAMESPASFAASHGLHVRVNYLGVTVSHTKRLTLSLSLDDGMDIFTGGTQCSGVPSAGGQCSSATWTAATVVNVPRVAMRSGPFQEKAFPHTPSSSTVPSEVSWMEVSGMSIVSNGEYSYVLMENAAMVDGGISVSPIHALLRSDGAAVVSNKRPYRASFAQLSCCLCEICVSRILAVESELFFSVMADVFQFAAAELIPTLVYELFFSSFTDAAVSITTTPQRGKDGCRVSWRVASLSDLSRATHATDEEAQPPAGSPDTEEASTLWLHVNPTNPDNVRGAHSDSWREPLASFGALLPALRRGPPPIIMTSDAATLTTRISAPSLCLALASAMPLSLALGEPDSVVGELRAESRFTLDDFSCEMPMGRMDCWAPDVQAIAIHPLSVRLAGAHFAVTSRRWKDVGSAQGGGADGATAHALAEMTVRDILWEVSTRSTAPLPPTAAVASHRNGLVSPAGASDGTGGDHKSGGRESKGTATEKNGSFKTSGRAKDASLRADVPWVRCCSPVSESETASCTSLDEELEDNALRIGSWQANVSMAHDSVHYSSAGCLVGKLQNFTAAARKMAARRAVRVTAALSCQNFDLGHVGTVYLDASGTPRKGGSECLEDEKLTVLVVESCSFTWPSTTTTDCIVVCQDTSVLFRNCVFKRPRAAAGVPLPFIRSADPLTGVFALQDCVEVDQPEAPSPPTARQPAQPLPNRPLSPKLRRRSFGVAVGCGGLRAQLNERTTLAVEQSPLYVSATIKEHSKVARIRSRGMRVLLDTWAAGAEPPEVATTAVCPRLTFELDVAEHLRRDSLALNVSWGVGEVFVPLIPNVLAASVSASRAFAAQLHAVGTLEGFDDDDGGFIPPTLPTQATLNQDAPGRDPSPADAALDSVSHSPRLAVDRMPYRAWKVLCSLSLTTICIGLPAGGLPLAKVTLSNAYAWSRRTPGAREAHAEARLALHDVAVWDFSSRSLRDVCANPLFFALDGHVTPEASCALQATASSGEFTLHTSQIRLVSTIVAQCAGGATPPQTSPTHSATISNDSGAELTLAIPAVTQPERFERAASSSRAVPSHAMRSADKPDCLGVVTLTVGGDSVVYIADVGGGGIAMPSLSSQGIVRCADTTAYARHSTGGAQPSKIDVASKPAVAPYEWDARAIAAEAHYVTFPDGAVLHVVATLCSSPASLVSQETTVRTTFQVVNESAFALNFSSWHSPVRQTVDAATTGSIPLGLLSCADVTVALTQRRARMPTVLRLRTGAAGAGADRQARSDTGTGQADDDLENGSGCGTGGDATASLREHLWEDCNTTPMQVLQAALRHPANLPAPFRREFVSQENGCKFYLAFEFAVRDRVLVMHVRPSQPCLRNELCFPITIEVAPPPCSNTDASAAGRVVHGLQSSSPLTITLNSGEEAAFYQLSPAFAHPVRFTIDANGEKFTADPGPATSTVFPPRRGHRNGNGAFDEGDCEESTDAVGRKVSFTAYHVEQAQRCQWELECALVFRQAGHRFRVWVVGAPQMALLVNHSAVDVTVTNASAKASAGSLGLSGLPVGSAGYVPLGSDLLLRAKGTGASDSFELVNGYAGGLIVCSHERAEHHASDDSAREMMAVCCLLRPSQPPPPPVASPTFELLPPVVFTNEGRSRTILIRHAVHSLRDEQRGEQFRAAALPTSGKRGPLCSHTVRVPPGGRVGHHWLSASGATNIFSISCDGGHSFSEAVESDLLPGTNWTGFLLCTKRGPPQAHQPSGACHFTHRHRVRVVKQGVCDTAFIVVEPASALEDRLVNFTSINFSEVEAFAAAPAVTGILSTLEACDKAHRTTQPSSHPMPDDSTALEAKVADRVVELTRVVRLPGLPSNVRLPVLSHGNGCSSTLTCLCRGAEGGPTALVLCEEGTLLCWDRLDAGTLTQAARLAPANDSTPENVEPCLSLGPSSSKCQSFVARLELQVSHQSVCIMDTAGFPLRIKLSSVDAWATCTPKTISAQLGVKGVSVDNTPTVTLATDSADPPRYVVSPFHVDLSIRDAQLHTPFTLVAQDFRVNCTRLTITLSDLLIAQTSQLVKQCTPPALCPRDSTGRRIGGSFRSNPVQTTRSSVTDPLRICVRSATISGVPICLSWDRSANTGSGADATADDNADGGGGWPTLGALIPSLHNVSLLIPRLQVTDLSIGSLAGLTTIIQQTVLLEVLRQVPRIVSTAGLFPRSASLVQSLASHVTSFLFGSGASEEDEALGSTDGRHGGAALV